MIAYDKPDCLSDNIIIAEAGVTVVKLSKRVC
jgi:hypothetical protein